MADYRKLEDTRAKCLALCGLLQIQDLIDESECTQIKTFVMQEEDTVKLISILLRFELDFSLNIFLREIRGFMGAPCLGLKRILSSSDSDESPSMVKHLRRRLLRADSCLRVSRSPSPTKTPAAKWSGEVFFP